MKGSVHDVIVVGLGAFGSSAAYHMARAGMRVLGLDAGAYPGHAGGSSHGHTRIIRLAYREGGVKRRAGSAYVPLLKRSYKLFQDLEAECGHRLLVKTGVLDIGLDVALGGAVESARMHGLSHELLTGAEVNKRFPGYGLPGDWPALYQPDGGMLLPEACIQAHCQKAVQSGAQLHWGQAVRRWHTLGPATHHGVQVEMANGTMHRAGQLVLAAGPWMQQLLPATKTILSVVRQVVGWFQIKAASGCFDARSFPVFILDSPPLAPSGVAGSWYGFPQWGEQPGFKIGLYNHLQQTTDPDTVSRHVTPEDEEALRAPVRRYFPAANGPLRAHSTCMFTNTPDGAFLVDRHPQQPQVLMCSACSGHGFKMSSGVGQLIAEDVMAWPEAPNASDASELAQHRLSPHRPGHPQLLEALMQQH